MYANFMILLLFLLIFAREFPKESNQHKARVPRRVGRVFPGRIVWFFTVSMTKVNACLSPKKMDVIKPTTPKKVIVEHSSTILGCLVPTFVCTLYPIPLEISEKDIQNETIGPLGTVHHHNLMAGIPHLRCRPGADSWTPSKDSAVFFSMFAWETDRMELSGGR